MYILSSRNVKPKHVSYNTVLGLEEEFLECMGNQSIIYFSEKVGFLNRICYKFLKKSLFIDYRVKNSIKRIKGQDKVFFPIMGLFEADFHINTLEKIGNRLVIYIFDCWESDYDQWDKLLKKINPYVVCFAYKKSAEYFAKKGYITHFMPQSMDEKIFYPREVEKNRLFIQMGRKVQILHELALQYMKKNNINDADEAYVYERTPGTIIFPDANELAKNICSTKFFFAAPQLVHNHKVTGDISEVTARFYEAMACKTLIVGIKPADSFDLLFPYQNAMIEVDKDNFDEKIDYYLTHDDEYKNMVCKNYDYVMKNHRWRNRYQDLLQFLSTLQE